MDEKNYILHFASGNKIISEKEAIALFICFSLHTEFLFLVELPLIYRNFVQ